MAYKKSSAGSHISVSSAFIEDYMPGADGSFVKVYLTGLAQCEKGEAMSSAQLADKLNMLESDVVKAWRYWQKCGAVIISEKDIEFVELSEKSRISADIQTKPVYTRDEVYSTVQEDTALRDMYRTIQNILGKPLSSNDIMIIYSFYDYYRLPTDVIPMLITYATGCDRKSMRSIEKIAQTWVDNGINTFEKATSYLKKAEKYNKNLMALKRAFGIYDRRLTESEEKYVKKWLEEFKLSVDVITYAYDITVTNTGKFSVKYMDKILGQWHEEGVKTPEEANVLRRNFKQSQTIQKPVKQPKKSGFNNFSQTQPFDYDALEASAYAKNRKTGE